NTAGMQFPDGWNVVKENLGNSFFVELIENRMEHYRRIAEEKLAVNRLDTGEISQTDSLLQTILAPHKGKVIYIDVWGSWCGPCREEMKHAPAIKKALKGKDVVFLYFAYSSDEVSWKNVIKENDITGDNVYHYNLLMEQQQLLNELWNLKAYPTHILYDKEGKMVTADAPSPSSKETLLLMINSLLDK
ncbi:MAG: TlpA family protein disulfide reductase, partial [Bacteroidaceae bacterium]|nr:TlpA family protein disulfide reductase [Bacteroidaceae bacterium]